MTRRLFTIGLLVVLLAAAGAAWLWPRGGRVAAVPIAGVDEPLPRAEPADEFILPEALEAARVEAQRQELRAVLVHRHGHQVFAYWRDADDAALDVDGGELADAVLALVLQQPEERASADAALVAGLVHERLWLPLRAGAAQLRLRAGPPPRCCIEARTADWMRVGDLLVGQGAYRGERFVAADAVRQWLAARQPAPAAGDEALVARDGLWFDLHAQARLWVAPRRNLSVLVWGEGARDTLIPNIILRGLGDQAPAIGGDIGDIVPGH